MTASKKKKIGLFKLGLRIALYSSLVSGASSFLVLIIFYNLSLLSTAIAACAIAFLVLLISYFFNYKLQYKRLEKLEEISRNISKKRFEEYQGITTNYGDEVDYLVKHFVKSSRTIEREIQRLNRIENYRKEFIGDISHELKTPIFAIQGFVETLLNGALEDEEVNREFLKKTMRNVNRLIYLTKDLMEISKLETGELKSDIEPFYLYEVIHDVVDSLQHKAERDDVKLKLKEFDKNLQVRGDKNQIKQVLINLIENGVKYNIKGGKVEIELEQFKKDKNRVLLSIRDTGIGIDESDLARVTERFFRVDKSRSRERGGTGLGLAIVKHIIEAHREQLFYESKINEGTIFKFTLRKVQ
ncbi:MAG: ATP-binding protein [Balneola sp.]|jgi:two-component system phosphate regulon sensor histidine kinase PhoR|tara:strand:- start:19761 stop:20831 length:1071 start_codon:yes stop_codon:yes gene_type:complete